MYAANPESTLVISPDNKSRAEINHLIHRELQSSGQLGEDHRVRVLVSRQEMTGADRQWAAQYEPGDVLRYGKGSKAMGIGAGEYMRVEAMDHGRNLVTVSRENGEQITYDPRRLQGVTCIRNRIASLLKATVCSLRRLRRTCVWRIANWAPSRNSAKTAI
ncbi:MAG: hypothetical protein M3Y72_21520 [Acidobacteriota bacterium]|nr:hypothetical protein [Acidobacteriota bacterium]